MVEGLIRWAGVGLLLIALANFFVAGVFRYRENLGRCDRFFGQVFKVHAAYIIYTVAALGALCLWRPGFFLEALEGRLVAGFLSLFWGTRVFLQVFYYDRGMARRFPVWNVIFTAAFGSLGVFFGWIALMP